MSCRPNEKRQTWEKLVEEQVVLDALNGTTCAAFKQNSAANFGETQKCPCGRLVRAHSFTGTPEPRSVVPKQWADILASDTAVTVYGRLRNDARFIRCKTEDGTFATLLEMMVPDVGSQPKLLVSCFGGARYFTMTDELEREFMSGIGQLAATTDVWLLTTGLNSGVSKLIGQGIHRNTLLEGSKWKPVAIGMNRWGALDEHTRGILKRQNKSVFLDENEPKTMDHHHSHFLLLDNGCLGGYLDDEPRSDFVTEACGRTKCYAVTIIVEGGADTLGVIQNDLNANRPVVIVHGSGRLATVLGNLLESAGKTAKISLNDVHEQLKLSPGLYASALSKLDELAKTITVVLDVENRKYLSVFRLGRDANLMNTIFRAVFDCQTGTEDSKTLLKLAVDWNCIEGAHDLLQRIRTSGAVPADNTDNDRVHYARLFEEALRKNRPQFVDYFLRRYYNPLETTQFLNYKAQRGSPSTQQSTHADDDEHTKCAEFAFQFIIDTLYNDKDRLPSDRIIDRPRNMDDLDKMYFRLIGPYAESFYQKTSIFAAVREALSKICCRSRKIYPDRSLAENVPDTLSIMVDSPEQRTESLWSFPSNWTKSYSKQEMLRDIFLWSIYENHIDIAFVILLQLKSRTCAALVGAGTAHRLSLLSKNPHIRSMYKKNGEALEKYASACIDHCYEHNEQSACQLLLREIPLFGNITCMQAAIATRSIPFINTDCFNRVLNRQWYDHLDVKSIESVWGVCKFTVCLVTLGLFAPRLIRYRESEKIQEQIEQYDRISGQKKEGDQPTSTGPDSSDETHSRSRVGIDVQYKKKNGYLQQLKQFHGSPAVMIAYDFVIYIWFLLVFSYLMLFGMRFTDDPIHWTEIYVIITVSASLIEDIRRCGVEVHTRMLERWHRKDMGMLIVYVMPYVLFYIGMGLHFGSRARPELFTAARIVLAIDLEIWYLFSLRFVSAIKLLGPKLFMIRNMMRDLVSLIYIIFVCMAAYGVVSRALTMYADLEFTASSVATAVFYRPYWFLYSIVDDEKKDLDAIISSNMSTSNEVAEATVNHVLLAFHMLFINILLLSLLIAMLNFSINDVQALNKYFWRYQRYELVREYFEKPLFAYPPLSLLVYVWMVFRLIQRGGTTRYRIFKHLATPALDAYWTDFENAATYNHARDLVEEKYRPRSKDEPKKSAAQPAGDAALQAPTVPPVATSEPQVQTEAPVAISELQAQTRELMTGMKWMMKAMKRVRMSTEELPWQESSSTTHADAGQA